MHIMNRKIAVEQNLTQVKNFLTQKAILSIA